MIMTKEAEQKKNSRFQQILCDLEAINTNTTIVQDRADIIRGKLFGIPIVKENMEVPVEAPGIIGQIEDYITHIIGTLECTFNTLDILEDLL